MRLRPSGKQGPVATTFAAFRDYQLTEAWTWEHLALTRARPMAGAPALIGAVEAFRVALLAQKGLGSDILKDVSEMRARLHAAKPAAGPWDVKPLPGGLMDIELIAETAALKAGDRSHSVAAQLAAGVARGWPSADQADHLLQSNDLCWQLHMVARLLGGQDLSAATIGEAGVRLVLRHTGDPDMSALEARLAALCQQSDRIVTDLLQAEERDEPQRS